MRPGTQAEADDAPGLVGELASCKAAVVEHGGVGGEPPRQIAQAPAHHAVDRGHGTAFHRGGQRLTLRLVQLGGVAARLSRNGCGYNVRHAHGWAVAVATAGLPAARRCEAFRGDLVLAAGLLLT